MHHTAFSKRFSNKLSVPGPKRGAELKSELHTEPWLRIKPRQALASKTYDCSNFAIKKPAINILAPQCDHNPQSLKVFGLHCF